MSRYKLYTYSNLEEFNKFYKELEEKGERIFPFKFQETGLLLEENNNVIEITHLVAYLINNPSDILPALVNFNHLDKDDKVIIKEELLDEALEIFAPIFEGSSPIYSVEKEEGSLISNITPFERQSLYVYKNEKELTKIIEYLNMNKIPIVNFSSLNNEFNEKLSEYGYKESEVFIDITSLVLAMESNPHLIYLSEQYLSLTRSYRVIVLGNIANKALEYLRMFFDSIQEITKVIPLSLENEDTPNDTKQNDTVIKVTDLDEKGLEMLCKDISAKLFGHQKFKDRFITSIKNFNFLNKINQKKLFSIFLLGPSGLGKTEFAKLIKENLNSDASLIKINFGNYSSQDSLNSLIGSPRGYIGSEEGGELGSKLIKSKVGIILCDEFEKATLPIFNFFLELLEDGVFTDSLSREHDIDGYIIIFTSNLDAQGFYKNIPEELQSRLDLVCEFQPLTSKEKQDYIEYFVENFLGKINQQNFITEEINSIKSVPVDSDNIRDINRILTDRILEKLEGDNLLELQNVFQQ
ncbi:AAA family ATPase [Priestia flexa]|uniref:ATP-dependent Clp protease ATP-binding subunit n=1 Tax=Priestia flexa TaxID=86664 RepID=A0A8I1SPK4_9BACI|nr:AAA family ATPase [Priestia flexa]MBN8253265.1 ATP-dependent Clp protease ATP-binding subunit [Priestia flexa]